ncbi:unnamed protein product [Symbiodinium necroappetens]|uniref:AAA+ ATPase domain-containing protein n=1 Tax=Symbiodinium necroappetens TaxID=1628268 RepID=A0A812J720_9DINO|nr:unnamed protein product [Symbiodinium necroappetens]
MTTPIDMEGAKFSMINSLRSGNAFYDTMLAMLIPLLFKLLFDGASSLLPFINDIWAKVKKMFRRPPPEYYQRTIEVSQMRRSDGYLYTPGPGYDRSTVLLRALTQYIADKVSSYKEAKVSLEDHYMEVEIENDDGDEDDPEKNTEIGFLKTYYQITQKVPEEKWIEVEPGLTIFLKVIECDRPPDKDSAHIPVKVTTEMTIKSLKEKQVVDFIDKSYQWYLDLQSKMQSKNKCRYMYEMIPSKAEEAEKRSYRRYKLSGDKSFQSLFFPEKDTLVQILDHFKHRTGKYGIPGYPHKLGLLLYGPPGTGKTSLIKVLAQHTERSIVNVPLARIKTNTELMQLIFDQKYTVEGIETPVRLRIKDVIFVMEDVDAASHVVHRRDQSKEALREELLSMQNFDRIERLEKLERLAKKLEKEEESEKSKPKGTQEGKTDSKEATETAAAEQKGVTREVDGKLLQQMLDVIHDKRGGETLYGVAGPSGEATGGDQLNLAGILNTLDGVVDTPGRLLVMTSNHPEKLDPALIRPGRIDKTFHLTYMVGNQACNMVAHYFQQEVSSEMQERLTLLLDGGVDSKALEITPARLEQLCAEHDTAEDLCGALELLLEPQPKAKLFRAESVSAEKTLASIQRSTTAPPDTGEKRLAKCW